MLKSPDKNPISIIKPSKLEYHLYQPGDGKKLAFSDDTTFIGRQKASKQSQINCNKPVLGGGFNPSSPKEIEEVYGNVEKPKHRSNSNR